MRLIPSIFIQLFAVLLCSSLSAQVSFDWGEHMDQVASNVNADDQMAGIDVDALGNVYVVGRIASSVDFDLNSAAGLLAPGAGVEDAFIAKYDAQGGFLWAELITNPFGGTINAAFSVAVDDLGNAYVVGTMSGAPLTRHFLTRYSPSGVQDYLLHFSNRTYPTTSTGLIGELVAVDDNGDVYVSGEFTGTINLDPGAGNHTVTAVGSNSDVYIAKFSGPTGVMQWARSLGGNGLERIRDIETDGNFVYAVGEFYDSVDFDPGVGVEKLGAMDLSDGFVARYSVATGDYDYAYSIGDMGFGRISDLELTSGGSMYLDIQFNGVTDMDFQSGVSTLNAGASFDFALAKYDKSNVTLDWAYLSPFSFSGGDLEVFAGDGIVSYGGYTGTKDFDPNSGTSNLTAGSLGGSTFAAYHLDATGNLQWATNVVDNNAGLWDFQMVTFGPGFYVSGNFNSSQLTLDPVQPFVLDAGAFGYDFYLAHYITCPEADFSYASATYCQQEDSILPIIAPGSIAGVFSASPAGLHIDSVSGMIHLDSSAAGTYVITNAIAIPGCSPESSAFTITINPLPFVDAGPDQTICPGGLATLTAVGDGSFLWTTGLTTRSIQVGTISSGTWSVILTDTNGCSNTDSVTVTRDTGLFIQADVDRYNVTSGVLSSFEVLNNDLSGSNLLTVISPPLYGTYIVNPDGTIDYTSDAGHVGGDTLIYEICDFTCSSICDTALVIITVDELPQLTIPNVFSPNTDGVNDSFFINGLDQYTDNGLVVFNRWGNIVFTETPYKNAWMGETNGKGLVFGSNVPSGVYYYILDLGPDNESKNGFVRVIQD